MPWLENQIMEWAFGEQRMSHGLEGSEIQGFRVSKCKRVESEQQRASIPGVLLLACHLVLTSISTSTYRS